MRARSGLRYLVLGFPLLIGVVALWIAGEKNGSVEGSEPALSGSVERERKFSRVDPEISLKTASRIRDAAGEVTVERGKVVSLAGRQPGEEFDLEMGAERFRAVMESWSDDGQVATFGVKLIEPAGRFQGTLRSDGRLRAEIFFDGKTDAFSLSDVEGSDRWAMKRSTVAELMCAPVGTAFKAAEGMPLDPTPPPPIESVSKDVMEAPPLLNSLPGAAYVIYCDFDGETVAHSKWNSGMTIVAQPHPNANDHAFVTRVWRRVAEDFSPFAINVTTDRAVFNAAPVARRVHCIITPTDTATPGSGGVAYLHSFGDGTPCWTFNLSEFACADTISHEVGHTLGLSHDGRIGGDVYYGGHGTGVTSWAPIMGAAWSDEGTSYTEYVTQWSRGEYPSANNIQDDLAIIAGNGFGYRADDKGSTRGTATAMVFTNGFVADSGIIEQTTDEDWLRFTTTGGTVSLQVGVVNVQSSSAPQPGANLAVALQLVDSTGAVVQTSNPTSSLGASVSASVSAGTYYLRIEGAGRGTASTGFTDYASLGQYVVTGSVPQVGMDSLAVSPPSLSVPAAGGTFNFDVSSSTNWSWTKTDAWLTSSEPPSQSGNQTFTYTIAANTGSSERTALITFTAGSLTTTHTVIQEGLVVDDHGNSMGSATVVAQNSSTPGNIQTAGDSDYFRINITANGVLLVGTTGSTDTIGYLLNSGGVELASDDDGAGSTGSNFQIGYSVTPGTYYVRVQHFSPTGTGAYVFFSSFASSPIVNVSPATASLGSVGSAGSFNVSSNAGWTWSSNVAWLYSSENNSQSGNQLFEYWTGSNSSSSPRTGVITISSGAVSATYTVTQSGVGTDDHGDTTATATSISPNSTTTGMLTAGDEDFFRIVISTPGTLTVRTTGTTDTYGYLLNAVGGTLTWNDDSYDTNFSITRPVTAGTYYVRIRHYADYGSGAYSLVSSLVTTPAPDISVEDPNGAVLAAGLSTVGFDQVNRGTSVTKVFTIRNVGTAVLGPISAGFVGGNTGDFFFDATPTLSIAAGGGSTTVAVRFSPGGNGARSTTLRIASNDEDESPFDIALTGTGVPVPEIAIEQPSGTGLSDGVSTVNFGSVNRGSTLSRTFTVRNQGTSPLIGVSASLSGEAAGDFSITSVPGNTVNAGSTTTFVVTFNPRDSGTRAALLQVASNDVDENPFDISLTGTGVSVPEIEVVDVVSSQNLIDGSGSVGLGAVNRGSNVTRTFSVRNVGTAPLTGVAASFNGGSAADYSVIATPTATVEPGESTEFTIRFAPSAAGGRNTTLRVASNDANENPFDISLTGTGVSVPEISVEQPAGTILTDGESSVDFGAVQVGQNASRTFTVRNLGTASLTGVGVTFSGGNPADFSVTTSPSGTVNSGSSTTFTVRLAPSAAGIRTTTLRIASNDADENPFDITLSGGTMTPRQMFDAAANGSGLSGGDGEPGGMPHGDGVKNLLKYAFNMNLGGTDSRVLVSGTGTAGLPSIEIEGVDASRMIKVEFLRRKDSGLTYVAKVSGTLETGSFTPMTGTPVVTSIDANWERVVIRDPATAGKNFAIVEVTVP